MPSAPCIAKAAYKKLNGALKLSDSHLSWTQDGKKQPQVNVPVSDAAGLFCSKEGAAQVRLKVTLASDDQGYNFTFTAPAAQAVAERERFKDALTPIVARNKNHTPAPHKAIAQKQSAQAAGNRPALPSRAPSGTGPGLSRATSVSSDRTSAQGLAESEVRLRKRVLLGSPALAALHKELVISGQISEAEFWEGREHLLAAQAAADAQKRGRAGTLVDPRPQTVEGESKIVITPQLVHDIFEEYPIVARAYAENVPHKLKENEFWTRYFRSRLFNALRASIRSSATQHVVKDDKIFDQYLEKEDDELEPRKQRDGSVECVVDLGATAEDHDETGNEKDVTMQPGRQRGALPLIRKFNEHSERLLNTALGDDRGEKRRRIDYDQLDLDDLHAPPDSAGIALEMQERQRYFEGRAGAGEGPEVQKVDSRLARQKAREGCLAWQEGLAQLKIERKLGDTALLAMTKNVQARLDVKNKKHDLPPALLRQLTTCQTAANEFLRQFWAALYARAPGAAQRAQKMAGYLATTREKVDALVRAAGPDGARVEVAMAPVMEAVEHALAVHRGKAGTKAAPGRG